MKKLGVFVGEGGLWTFFNDIYDHLETRFETHLYQPPQKFKTPLLHGRLNRWAYRQSIRSVVQNCDLNFFEWASEYLQIASEMPKTNPIVTRLHSFELYDWAPRIHWENVDKIIFISKGIEKKFIEMFPEQRHKTIMIYNAVPVDKFQPIQREFDFSIGMLGTIAPIKRVYEMVLMVKELQDLGYHPSLHIAGGKMYKDRIDRYYIAVQQAVKKLKLQNNVKFYGHVNNPAQWFQNIDIFISHSYWEGLQTALVEAMAAGRYCLGHFWDGVEEALPPDYIYSTETELKDKLITFASLSLEERLHLSKNLSNIAREKFNIYTNRVLIGDVLEAMI